MLNEYFHVSRVLGDRCVNFTVRSAKVKEPCLLPGWENEEIPLNASKISFLCVCVYLWWVKTRRHMFLPGEVVCLLGLSSQNHKMVNPGKAKGRNHAFLSWQFTLFKGAPGFQAAASVCVLQRTKTRWLEMSGSFLEHCVNTSVSGNSLFAFFLVLSFCSPVVLVWFTQLWRKCVCPTAREEMEGDSIGGR